MKRVLLYGRVSSDEQAAKGFSLRFQKEQLERFCHQNDYQIIKYFEEDYSAKNFSSRPEFQKLMRFAKSHKKEIDALYFLRWDRFSRNISEAYRIIGEFNELGIEVNAIEQPLDLNLIENKVLLALQLVLPEIENDKNSLRTTEGMRKAMSEGCFTGIAPKGYINSRNLEGKSTLTPDPKTAPLISSIFETYATGLYSAEELRKKYYKQGLKISRNGFLALLKNPTYMGKIYIKPYKKEDEQLVEGLHPSLVSEQTFLQVQKVLKGKFKAPFRTYSEIDQALPLRGFLLCPLCNKVLTGSGSKGRDKKNTYFYYHCTRFCKTRYKATEVNSLLEELLLQMRMDKPFEELYKKIVAHSFAQRKENKTTQINSLKREDQKLLNRLDMLEEHFFEKQIDATTFNSMKQKIQTRQNQIQWELKEINQQEVYFEKHLKEGISFLNGIDRVYKQADVEIKKKILKTLFIEKLIYNQDHFYTPALEPTIEVILSIERNLPLLKTAQKSSFHRKLPNQVHQ